jgi:hypothetical protein
MDACLTHGTLHNLSQIGYMPQYGLQNVKFGFLVTGCRFPVEGCQLPPTSGQLLGCQLPA